MTARKGARRRADVTVEIRTQLNAGTLETASLLEALVVDFQVLLRTLLPKASKKTLASVDPATGYVARMSQAATVLMDHYGPEGYDRLRVHSSDTVRGWAAYILAATPDLDLADAIERIRPLADDPHFGVREWAWMAVRPLLAAELSLALRHLRPWTAEASANLRRFAVESVRPVGVWTAQIVALRKNPELALPLLEPLRSDGVKYVQDSVANWLNDAARSRADWVREVCQRWREESATPATARIVHRALRRCGLSESEA